MVRICIVIYGRSTTSATDGVYTREPHTEKKVQTHTTASHKYTYFNSYFIIKKKIIYERARTHTHTYAHYIYFMFKHSRHRPIKRTFIIENKMKKKELKNVNQYDKINKYNFDLYGYMNMYRLKKTISLQ